MASTKRSPITYEPAFGSSIFRSKSDVEGDLARLERDSIDNQAPGPTPLLSSDADINENHAPTNVRTNVRTGALPSPPAIREADERSHERTNANAIPNNGGPASGQTFVRTDGRPRVRHSFDIYSDQLVSLGDIQIARHRQTGRRPKLGDLAQEALDAFIAANERTNERSR